MPLSVTNICARALQEAGLPTQSAYVNTQTGYLLDRAAQEISQLPLSRPSKAYSFTMVTQDTITIDSASRSGATVTIDMPVVFDYPVGGLVQVAGITPTTYNGNHVVTETQPDLFKYVVSADPGGYTSGGTATFLAYPLPSDFRTYVPDTAYISGNLQRVLWPTDPQEWAILKAGNVDPGGVLIVRQLGGFLYIHAPLPGETLQFEYQSNALWTDSTGFTAKQRISADSDLWTLDDDLLILALKWRVKKEFGLDDWQIDLAEWKTYSRNYLADNRGGRAIMIGGAAEQQAVPPYTNLWVS